MSFKPKDSGQSRTTGEYEPRVNVKPKAGPRKARVSLIIDLGIQKRDDFEDEKTGEKREMRPCQQIAVFADLVNDNVDYGGKIGVAQYRLMLNKMFGGVITGINFTIMSPQDANGKFIDGKPKGFHPRNKLTELCKATGRADIAVETPPNGLCVDQLLGLPFIADVEVKETTSDKKDKDGNEITYINVNYKGASQVPMIETDDLDTDGNAIEVATPVADLKQKPRCITFDNATVEDIQFIRLKLLQMIKLAEDYPGSQMQKAVEEYEATKQAGDEKAEADSEPAPGKTKVTPAKSAATKPAAKSAAKPAAKPAADGVDDDLPF